MGGENILVDGVLWDFCTYTSIHTNIGDFRLQCNPNTSKCYISALPYFSRAAILCCIFSPGPTHTTIYFSPRNRQVSFHGIAFVPRKLLPAITSKQTFGANPVSPFFSCTLYCSCNRRGQLDTQQQTHRMFSGTKYLFSAAMALQSMGHVFGQCVTTSNVNWYSCGPSYFYACDDALLSFAIRWDANVSGWVDALHTMEWRNRWGVRDRPTERSLEELQRTAVALPSNLA